MSVTLRRKARQFSRLVGHSVAQPRTGESYRPLPARNGEMGLTFIGHSAFLLQLGGRNVLVDPNFARWLFILKRLRRPGVLLRDLPPIDYVLVTHAHFDHLHRPSLRRILRLTRRLTGRSPKIVVPQHVADLVRPLGFQEVFELDWWDAFEEDGFKITHVPARHWGARVIRDTHRGYGGYVLEHGGQSIYHAGDTAYFKGFHEIGERLRPQISLLPIGAYHPESFRNVHASPEDAVQAFLDLRSEWMVPMHYGTFRLSHEPIEEPVQRLRIAASQAGVSDRVLVLEEGHTRFFS